MKRLRITIIGITLFFVSIISGLSLFFNDPAISAFSSNDTGLPVLIIDPGHGGEDGGAVSLTGVCESHINLAIARRLDSALSLVGYPTQLLRQSDISLHDRGAVTIRQKKVSDLHNRADFVNRHDDAVLISIHQNSYPGARYSGAQVFYAPDDASNSLAEHIQNSLIQNLDPTNKRQIKQIPDNLYLFQHITCPAVLIECGFLTNPREEALLQQPDYQTKLAAIIAASYLKYHTQ